MTIGSEGERKPDPVVGGQRANGPKRAMTVIIVILVVIIMIMSVLYLTKPTAQTAPTVANQSISGDSSATVGTPFHFSVNVGTSFKTVQVFFGDGSSVTVPYSGSDNVSVVHTYMQPGEAIVSYQVTYSNGATAVAAGKLYPVRVLASSTSVSDQESLGVVNYNYSASSTSIASGKPVFKVGSFVNFIVSYFGEPSDSSYQIVMQNVSVSYGGKEISIPYAWNTSSDMYVGTQPSLNFTFNDSGVYSVSVITYTAEVNGTTGKILSSLYSTQYFYDVAIFDNGAVNGAATGGVFTAVATTPYDSLDPSIGYGVNDYQITLATYQTLVTWNGSHSTQFEPELASQLPTVSNGEVNNNYKNYTSSYVNGTGATVTYNTFLQPHENYTFHVRSNATWQDGTSVTAWDVMYSITRALLFIDGSPGTPGWITAQYLIPGNIYSQYTTSFYNITTNITVDNASNTITFHFQVPMSNDLVYNLFSAIGSQITSAKWLIAHGAGLTWTPAGFQAYKTHGLVANYLNYPQNHVMSDGPFEIAYIVPSSEVVLIPNPNYVAPGPWMPKTTLSKVVLLYTSEEASMQLMMQSGQANSAGIPSTNWQGVKSLEAQGKASVYNYTMLGVYYDSYNFNINTTELNKQVTGGANVPQYLFTNLTARRAFSYAFDYGYYLNQQVGNAIYGVDFADAYAGMLAKGMLGYQSIADLNKTTNGHVPYFDLQTAKQYWNELVNSSFNKNSKYPITYSTTKHEFLYKGAPLSIPIAIFAGIPQEQAGATTWQSYLQQIIPGITMPQIVESANIIVDMALSGSNPWPIWSATWFPDYPYPSDYLGPMAEPVNNTFIPGPDSFTPYTLTVTGHTNQAANATEMVNWYDAGYVTPVSSQALVYFHKMNDMLVNMTSMLFLEQLNGFWIMSPSVNGTYVHLYQSNLMYASGGDLLLNWIRMNPSS